MEKAAQKKQATRECVDETTTSRYPRTLMRSYGDLFYCKHRRRKLLLEKCLNDYLTANAFCRARSVCYRCPQGRRNREDFANG